MSRNRNEGRRLAQSKDTPPVHDDVQVFLFQDLPAGQVHVTFPTGDSYLLEPDADDAYRHDSVMAELFARAFAEKIRPKLRRSQFVEAPLLQGEHLYTPQELAGLTSLHVSTIRKLFIDEPGVIISGKQNRRDGKRDYVTLRIPASVAERKMNALRRKK